VLALIGKIEILGIGRGAPAAEQQKQDKNAQRKTPARRAFYIVV